MKAYKKLEIEVLELEEDIVRTSPVGVSKAEDFNIWDDVVGDFGA